jgi:hypothetical protein
MHRLIDRNRSRDSAHGSAPGAPRWVKVSGALALIAVVVVVVVLVAGGGQHGPGRHTSRGGGAQQEQPGGQVPRGVSESQIPSGGGAGGHTPPAGGH